MNSYDFEKYIKSIENKIYKNAAEAIKEMPAVIKDEAFATTRPESAMKILKKNPMYGKLRDEWLEANIWAFFNSPIYKKGWTDTEYMFGEETTIVPLSAANFNCSLVKLEAGLPYS